ncbi:P-loop containing nucleoside triphosphate hydrolase protein [Umbelopsis sp. AD052]|nr:P-loop containing nucleoside triphosphate hydrolase protein [Umbelopsis sp. AD052]
MWNEQHLSRDKRDSSAARSDSFPLQNARASQLNSRYGRPPRSEKDEKGTNIQVVVRCRGRTQREIAENIPVVVDAASNTQEITLKTTNKTYTFDRVFGQETSQQRIYDDVVSPILQEMLMGYNCTIFAYGQTGTGKTYTMEGDLEDQEGYITRDAGIIPRTLYHLFDVLDQEEAEYAVRISSIELYNEELKDLLNPGDDRPKLRIFEDPNGTGVIVQGLEEALINSAEDGVRAIQLASRNRRIAATRCNDKSSRSHCVFTLTVHIKETLADGEELLKVGKLNLVDLAGSENIGRSGAENARAREAGLINQSLLTLGRVINHLVEHSVHVPYRESKLTRLLRDSLGGRTKTCIIATIATAKIHYEEIISTLDYASRAKNIRNKPEVNQRMTKKELIKEYIHEIERLKSDLQATREKKGVFMSADSYRLLLDENQSKKDQVEEITKEIQVFKDNVQNLTKEVEQKAKLLMGKQRELREVNDKLQETKNWLQKIQDEHERTKQSLEEQVALRKYHQQYGDKLEHFASETISTLQNTVKDNDGLFSKLDRQRSVQEKNRGALHAFKKDVDVKAHKIVEEMLQFKSSIGSMQSDLEAKAQAYADALQKNLSAIHHGVETRLKALEQESDTLNSLVKDGGAAQNGLYNILSDIHAQLEESTKKHKDAAKQEANAFLLVTNAAFQKFSEQLTVKHSVLTDMLADYISDIKRTTNEQQNRMEQLRASINVGIEGEKAFVQEKEDQLKQIVHIQQQNRAKAKKQLMHDISLLLQEYDSEEHERLQKSMYDVQSSLRSNGASLDDLQSDHNEDVDRLITSEMATVQAAENHYHTMSDQLDSLSNLKEDVQTVESGYAEYQERSSRLNDEYEAKVAAANGRISDSVKAARSKQAKILELHSLEINKMQKTSSTVRNGLSSRVSDIIAQSQDEASSVHRWAEENKQLVENHKLITDDEIEQLQNEVHQLLRSKIEDDPSTGETPRRTSYRIPATVTPRVSNEALVRRLQEAISKPTPADSSEEVVVPRSSIERERSQLPQPSYQQQERELTHIKLEPVKEENDLVDSSDLRSFPKTSLPKRSDSRFASTRGLFAHKAHATDVTSGNEPALRDKTNGDRFSSGNGVIEPKLAKRRLPTEATDTLYKRRRAPESSFWRS